MVVPDLVYVSNQRVALLTERAIEGPPDLVVEILSPTTERRDRGAKMKLYARFGVDHYWLVDTIEKTVDAYERRGDQYGRADSHRGNTVMACRCPVGLEIDSTEVWFD